MKKTKTSRKRYLMSAIAAMSIALSSWSPASAAPLKVCDFEDYPLGTTWTLWQSNGIAFTSTAIVERDPANNNNKVLHIKLKDWGCHPEFSLPTTLTGKALTDRYPNVRFQIYRSSSETDDWKQMAVFIGGKELYRDEGYPHQGDKAKWQTRQYALAANSDDNTSDKLHLGIHHNNSDYYIDNIELIGAYDDYTTVTDGQLIDQCSANTDKSYATISTPLYLPEGVTASVRTSRYSEWTGNVAGPGTLNIYAGGERTYIGTKASKGATYPDWTGMTGHVNVYPYKAVIGSCGFYGLIINSGTFSPDNIDGSNYNRLFSSAHVTLHEGATLSMESGTRGARIGELNTAEGSEIIGYYKASTANSYLIVGCLNTDALLAGRIYAANSGNTVGIIKEGTGTYTISGNTNVIGSGIQVRQGSLIIANDISKSKSQRLSGATGNQGSVVVYQGATLTGNGNVSAKTEVYGKLSGKLQFADYTSATAKTNVTLHPEAIITLSINDATSHDSVFVSGKLEFSNRTQDFEDSDKHPLLKVTLDDDAQLAINDEITLLHVGSGSDLMGNLRIKYPKQCTWLTEQRQFADGTIAIVARVTSLDDNPDYVEGDDEEMQGNADTIYPDSDWENDKTSATPLRTYASKLNKSIGVAAASYRYDLSNDNARETRLVGREFNLIVGENEMKFDATEPSQNTFSYGGSDAIMWLADRQHQEVRGHTLAWHSQVPQWVSSDGKKNNNGYTRQQLLDILHNHINKLVGKYKGKIREWDVVNEVLDDDQSIVRSNPKAYKLRPSIWSTYIGEDFIDSAFVWAHRADPNARLFINDYGVEFQGRTKTEAYYNLITRLKASGIPVDGCGLQTHITTGQLDTLRLEKNIQRYAAIGMDCIITELDIALADPSSAECLDRQAKEYAAIARIWLRNANCPTMLIWGISDNNSWRQNKPLLYDSNCDAKPAYYAIHAELRKATEAATSIQGVTDVSANASALPVNLIGQKVNASYRGIIICPDGKKVMQR